jgi:hypothetical protein
VNHSPLLTLRTFTQCVTPITCLIFSVLVWQHISCGTSTETPPLETYVTVLVTYVTVLVTYVTVLVTYVTVLVTYVTVLVTYVTVLVTYVTVLVTYVTVSGWLSIYILITPCVSNRAILKYKIINASSA